MKLVPILQDSSPGKAPGKRFASARRLPNTNANVTFQKKDKTVIVTLNLLRNGETTVIFQGRPVGISAAKGIQYSDRLSLNFPVDDQMIIVNGDRREIEWLYNELSEWADIQTITWREPPELY